MKHEHGAQHKHNTSLLFMEIMNKSTNLWSVYDCVWRWRNVHEQLNEMYVARVNIDIASVRYSFNKQMNIICIYRRHFDEPRRQLCMHSHRFIHSFIQLVFVHSAHKQNERCEKNKKEQNFICLKNTERMKKNIWRTLQVRLLHCNKCIEWWSKSRKNKRRNGKEHKWK